MTRRVLTPAMVVIGVAVYVAASLALMEAQQGSVSAVAIDADDIGGVATSARGPEAGIWVIAETTDLPTKFAKIVVTDDQGRYLLPDLPKATYKVWVRGYGLVDSAPVTGAPGTALKLTAVAAPNARAAAAYYPANYWFALLQVPPASEFPGPGPQGNGIPTRFTTQEAWISQTKNCLLCHQLGNKETREIPKSLGTFDSSVAAWDRRVQSGHAGAAMSNFMSQLGRSRGLAVFADWTDRIAAGEFPTEVPPRPRGAERNLVVTMWDWGGNRGLTWVHDEIATDKRNPTINANRPVYGTGDSDGTVVWVDPVKHTAEEAKIPTLDPSLKWGGNAGHPQILLPSPYWGEEIIWPNPVSPHNPMIDHRGRVWITAKLRDPKNLPGFCKPGSANPFAAYFPSDRSEYEAAVYDPETKQFSLIDTCFSTHHLEFAEDKDNTLYFSNGDVGGVVGWINTRVWDETRDAQAAQGWCPAVLDTNGDGKITRGWTEPDQPVDPAKDHRVSFGCYGHAVNLADGTVWCAPAHGPGNFPGTITRLVVGPNPPQTCKAEVYEPPPGRAYNPRGIDFDRNGVAWVNFSGSGHMASFDRRKCKVLNGPRAIGQHCPEGWTFYPEPGPKMKGVNASADWSYLMWVDRFDTLGLGTNVPMTQGVNSDSLLALMPQTGQWVTMRVPYPLGFYARLHDGRIDDPKAGWKGRGIWTTYASVPNWHIEGGKGTRSKLVKIQMRPDPLAK